VAGTAHNVVRWRNNPQTPEVRLQVKHKIAYPRFRRKIQGESFFGKLGQSKAPLYLRKFRKLQVCTGWEACSEKTLSFHLMLNDGLVPSLTNL